MQSWAHDRISEIMPVNQFHELTSYSVSVELGMWLLAFLSEEHFLMSHVEISESELVIHAA